tara:strand:+ start:10741 stop:10854 length:114 start_codon:yes stop_codon:yes gene_type:complete
MNKEAEREVVRRELIVLMETTSRLEDELKEVIGEYKS